MGRKMGQTKYKNFEQKAFEQNSFILLLLLIANKFGRADVMGWRPGGGATPKQ